MKKKKITKFSKDNCSPCEAFQSAWEELKVENPDVIFTEVDAATEEGRKLAASHGARQVPFFINQDGAKINGTTTKEAFQQILLK